MSFDTEQESFEAYARAMPNNSIFLVDTYDTARGIANAIRAGLWLREQGHEMQGIRLDSGDLVSLSVAARRTLDEAGFSETKIVASGDLDEDSIAELYDSGAPIAILGVGTKLATAYDDPALGGVYKLSAIRDEEGNWQPKLKTSNDPAKASIPGFLQARRFTKEGNLEARQAFEKALEIVPDCAPAYAHLAKTYFNEFVLGWSESRQLSAKLAKEYAEKALSLDETLPLAHGMLGFNYLWAKQHDLSISEMERWIELDPKEADAYLGLAQTLNYAGRPTEALPLLDKTMRLNPNYGFLTLLTLGQAHFMEGRYVEAINALERAVVHNPQFMGSNIYLAASYAEAGEVERAHETVATIRKHSPETLDALTLELFFPYKRAEDFTDLMNALHKAGLPE